MVVGLIEFHFRPNLFLPFCPCHVTLNLLQIRTACLSGDACEWLDIRARQDIIVVTGCICIPACKGINSESDIHLGSCVFPHPRICPHNVF
jgi:hypothetical protein